MVMGLGVMSCIRIVFSIEGDAWNCGFDFDINIDNAKTVCFQSFPTMYAL